MGRGGVGATGPPPGVVLMVVSLNRSATDVSPSRDVFTSRSTPPTADGYRRVTSRPPRRRRGWFVVLLALLLVGAGAVAVYTASNSVQVTVDGETLLTRTFATDVATVLDRLEIELADADRVEPSPATRVEDGLEIVVLRARTVEVVVDGGVQRFETHADTVGDALADVGVRLRGEDRVDPPLDHKLDQGLDQGLDQPLTITVQRVRIDEATIDHLVDHGEQRKETVELPIGETRVQTEGREGLRREVYEITFVDGEEVARELVVDSVVRQPVDRIVLVGVAPTTIHEAQSLLVELGYPVGSVDGIEGPKTLRALCAWRRLEGREVDRQPLRPGELEALQATIGFPEAPPGRGVTVDKTCQTVYFRDGGRWQDVHPASTGTGGLPRVGNYQVQRMRAGWHTSTLYPAVEPNMYNTLYFHGAIAIHGSHHVPPHPASAGCVRVTPQTADRLFADLQVGDPIEVVGAY